MALHWDITRCANSDELLADDDAAAFTDLMIWSTLGVGIGSITEDNWPEFYARLHVAGYATNVTPQQVHRYVGLGTNVSNETRLQWMKRIVGQRLDEEVRHARREVSKADAAS